MKATETKTRYLNEAEAASELQLTKRQLAEERRRGGISYSRIFGRRIRYTMADLEEYMSKRRCPAEV
jgi:hypothetical protein